MIVKYRNASYHRAYIQQDLSWLKSFLTMSEAAKGSDLVSRYPQEFAAWIADTEHAVTTTGLTGAEVAARVEAEDYEVLYDVTDAVAKSFLSYGNNSENIAGDVNAPSYYFFDFQRVIQNQWLIHFTDNSYDIVRNGFAVGMPDLERLGLTTMYTPKAKSGGYNFAYTLDAFERYGRRASERDWKYGRDVVLFQASGLELWHHTDEEPQVIFWGASAKNIIEINLGDYYEWDAKHRERYEETGWVVPACDGGPNLFGAEKLSTVVDWVVRNFDQYRRKLVCED